MKIYAFHGLRFQGPDAGALAAPPFDQIDDSLRDRLHRAHPHHFSHLSRPLPGEEGDAHRHAASLHRRWVEEEVIRAEPSASLYPYTIDSRQGGTRLGLCALVGVGGRADTDLRPHEETVAKPIEDRLGLLRATGIDLEPVLLLAEDDDGAFEETLRSDVATAEMLVRHSDRERGDEHALYRLSDSTRIAAYRELLASRWAAIADGHHRTKVAQIFARESGAAEGTAAAAKLAVLTSLSSRELRIDPIHRALLVPVDEAPLASCALSRQPWGGDFGRDLAAAVAKAPQPSAGVWIAGGRPEIWRLDPSTAPPEAPGGGSLPVVLLHYQLLAAAGFGLESSKDGSIAYRSDADRLYAMVASGEAMAGFWLPPMEAAGFAAATARSELLPPKSTRFLPKLVSGLVWSSHDGEIA